MATAEQHDAVPSRRLSAFFYRRRWLKAILLLLPPLGWMTVIYLASSASDFMCGSLVAVDGGFVAQ